VTPRLTIVVLAAMACHHDAPIEAPQPEPALVSQWAPWDAPADDAPPFDRELVDAVEQRMALEPSLAASGIDVAAKSGRIRLFGSVQSVAQKNRAVAMAWVDGVVEVDASELDVLPGDGVHEGPSPESPVHPDEDEPGEVVFGRER
jgi:hypothetical protein